MSKRVDEVSPYLYGEASPLGLMPTQQPPGFAQRILKPRMEPSMSGFHKGRQSDAAFGRSGEQVMGPTTTLMRVPGATALVFDDHVEVARLLQLRLNQIGLTARCVNDRTQFITEFSASPPQFLFLDLALGATDAVEILGLLKAASYRGRIILMSGAFTLALDHVSRIGRRYGLDMAGILKKPFRWLGIAGFARGAGGAAGARANG